MEIPEPGTVEQQMRLNRFLPRCGIASRRRSDELIQSGVIRINGEIVDEPGRVVAIGNDRVEYQGQPVALPDLYEYVLLNKPAGYLVTRSDPDHRPAPKGLWDPPGQPEPDHRFPSGDSQ